MTSTDFFSLPINAQEKCLFHFGELISEIEEKNCYTSLFLISHFYVEVFLCKYTRQVVNIIKQEDPEVQILYLQKLQLHLNFVNQ